MVCTQKLLYSGVFNCRTNKDGVVRDHIYSRKHGFDNLVFPEILRHPCNCQVLTVSSNSSKRANSWISLNELFSLIENYTGNWVEQNLVILLINEYRNGSRWKRKEAVGE